MRSSRRKVLRGRLQKEDEERRERETRGKKIPIGEAAKKDEEVKQALRGGGGGSRSGGGGWRRLATTLCIERRRL
jgi:hypothetical protein